HGRLGGGDGGDVVHQVVGEGEDGRGVGVAGVVLGGAFLGAHLELGRTAGPVHRHHGGGRGEAVFGCVLAGDIGQGGHLAIVKGIEQGGDAVALRLGPVVAGLEQVRGL